MGLVHQLHGIPQAITHHGVDFTVKRDVEDIFKESIWEQEIGAFRGLFHTSSSFLTINYQDKGQVFTEKKPKLLILYTDRLRVNDKIYTKDGRSYSVTGIDDLGGLHLCLDLSLKEM